MKCTDRPDNFALRRVGGFERKSGASSVAVEKPCGLILEKHSSECEFTIMTEKTGIAVPREMTRHSRRLMLRMILREMRRSKQ